MVNKTKNPNQSPIIYILVGAIIVLLIIVFRKENKQVDRSTIEGTQQAIIAIKLKCVPWMDVSNYDEGKHLCVYGRIIETSAKVVEESGETIYGARFSDNDLALRLMSSDRDFGQWKNKCVVVNGSVSDTSLIRDFLPSEYPPYIDLAYYSDGNSNHLFGVKSISDEVCD